MSSSELKPIILYDIPCLTPGRPWSPNTLKTRYCLRYKQLPFTTTWVEYPDIAGLLQSKGITHPPYTLPAIEDPNTGAFIVDSLAIATYLDKTYPETPKVLTPAARTALEATGNAFSFQSGVASASATSPNPRLVFLILATEHLNPVSKVYYHQTRTARLGEQWTAMAEACAAGPAERAERVRQGMEAFSDVWRKATAMYVREDDSAADAAHGSLRGGPFLLGGNPSFVDFAIAGRVRYAVDALGPSDGETLKNLEGGRLWRVVEDLERCLEGRASTMRTEAEAQGQKPGATKSAVTQASQVRTGVVTGGVDTFGSVGRGIVI